MYPAWYIWLFKKKKVLPDWKKITSAARETDVSRHHGNEIEGSLKPLNTMECSEVRRGFMGALIWVPHDAESRTPHRCSFSSLPGPNLLIRRSD